MVTGYTFNSYVDALSKLLVVDSTDANFQALLPSIIDYAELRLCQDIDFLSTVSSYVGAVAPGSRQLTFPLSTFITLQNVNFLTPAGTADPNIATRNPCLMVTKEYLNFEWPSSSGAGLPKKCAMVNQNTLALGPWPDLAYSVELVGTTRPASLSSSNTTTFISTYLPSHFMMASMVFGSGYQRNFGAQSSDPAMSVSYETQYQALLKSAQLEEARKKFTSSGWTSMSPAVAATPSRG